MVSEQHNLFGRWISSQRQNEYEIDEFLKIRNPPLVEVTIGWYSVMETDGTYHIDTECRSTKIKRENLDFATEQSLKAFNNVPRRKDEHKFKLCSLCDPGNAVLFTVREESEMIVPI